MNDRLAAIEARLAWLLWAMVGLILFMALVLWLTARIAVKLEVIS